MKTAKLTIDGNVFTVSLFKVDGKHLTTNIGLSEGTHTLTSVVIYDDKGEVINESDVVKTFTVSPTFPFELPIQFETAAGNQSLIMRAVAEPKAPVYLKLPENLNPDPEETHSAKLVGVLGIPDADKHFYQNDSYYSVKPITSKMKLRFAVHVIEVNADGSGLEQDNWFMYNWGESQPLEITWNKPKEGNEVRLIIQMYYAFTNDQGDQQMTDVNSGSNGEWTIHLQNSDEPIKDADGFTHISLMPDSNWQSDADYKYFYPVFE